MSIQNLVLKAGFHATLNKDSCHQMWSSLMCVSNVNTTRIQSVKLLNFWYTTPKKLNHIDSKSSPLCWKCNNVVGDYNHCWWDCILVKAFWTEIHNAISEIAGIEVPFSKESLLLNIWEDEYIPPPPLRTKWLL